MSDLLSKIESLSKSYKSVDNPEFIKSGSVVIDALLGGGIPKGSFILWSSHSGIGKTTSSLYISKSYCVQGKKVLYLDFEGGVNENQLEGIGLLKYKYSKSNPNGTFYVFRAHTFYDAEQFLDNLIGEVDLIVIDSVTAILPEKMKEISVEKIQPGLQARLMANLLLKYKAESMKRGTTWIMINQMRTHIRFIGQTTDEEAGGNALKFYSDYRILMKKAKNGDLERTEMTSRGKVTVPYGSINEIWCVKSRYSRPFIPLKLAVIFGKGISNVYAYYDYLETKKVIKKSGSWYTITMDGEEKHKCQGFERVIEWINKNKDLVKEFIRKNGGYKLIVDEKAKSININEMDYSSYDSEEEQEKHVSMAVGDINDENI